MVQQLYLFYIKTVTQSNLLILVVSNVVNTTEVTGMAAEKETTFSCFG